MVSLDEPVAGLRMELGGVPEGSPVAGELMLESVAEGVFVTGRISSRIELTCARCLRAFERDIDVEVADLFAHGAEIGDESYPLDPGGSLDPEPMVRDAVLLALPFTPLCRPECLGLCERCGGDRNLGECTCTEPLGDPRWAGLERLSN